MRESLKLLNFTPDSTKGRLLLISFSKSSSFRIRDPRTEEPLDPCFKSFYSFDWKIFEILWKKQRFYSDLSHWMFRLGFCRTNELKAWLTTQETNLFRFQLRQLTQNQRKDVYQGLYQRSTDRNQLIKGLKLRVELNFQFQLKGYNFQQYPQTTLKNEKSLFVIFPWFGTSLGMTSSEWNGILYLFNMFTPLVSLTVKPTRNQIVIFDFSS